MASDGKKLTQAEMLQRLSPPPFNQKKCVPENATIELSPADRWHRSDSPRGEHDDHPDVPPPKPDPNMSETRGVLGYGQRSGPACFQTLHQTGPGVASHFKVPSDAPAMVSGFSGHIAGKVAGNCIGGTFEKANCDAQDHLKTTSQTLRYGTMATMPAAGK